MGSAQQSSILLHNSTKEEMKKIRTVLGFAERAVRKGLAKKERPPNLRVQNGRYFINIGLDHNTDVQYSYGSDFENADFKELRDIIDELRRIILPTQFEEYNTALIHTNILGGGNKLCLGWHKDDEPVEFSKKVCNLNNHLSTYIMDSVNICARTNGIEFKDIDPEEIDIMDSPGQLLVELDENSKTSPQAFNMNAKISIRREGGRPVLSVGGYATITKFSPMALHAVEGDGGRPREGLCGEHTQGRFTISLRKCLTRMI